MADKKEKIEGYVKHETLLIVSFIMLIIGFLGGVVFAIYKSVPIQPVQQQEHNHTAEEPPAISDEMAAKISELEKKTSDNPNDIDAWTELGHLYFDSNNYDKAIWAYTKSLALDPKNADVMTDLGVMYRKIGNPSEAIKCFDKAVELNPNHEIARFNKGIVLMHDLNDIEGAVKIWEELVKLNPDIKTPSGQSVKEMIQRFKGNQSMGGE
jgi:cytochrome c-type biogenesis protein CcmH/NrfG